MDTDDIITRILSNTDATKEIVDKINGSIIAINKNVEFFVQVQDHEKVKLIKLTAKQESFEKNTGENIQALKDNTREAIDDTKCFFKDKIKDIYITIRKRNKYTKGLLLLTAVLTTVIVVIVPFLIKMGVYSNVR